MSCAEYVYELVEFELKALIKLIESQIKQNEKLIINHLIEDKELNEIVKNIIDIKGVNYVTVGTILAETNFFEMFSNMKQLVSYSGYDVVANQSGKHVGRTKISKKGNSRIRRILHMAALNSVTFWEPKFVALYNRVFERTKIKMKGYVAVQRELLCLTYTLFNNKQAYDRSLYTHETE